MQADWILDAALSIGDYPVSVETFVEHCESFDWRTLPSLFAGILDRGGPRAEALLELFGAIAAGEVSSTGVSRPIIAGCLQSTNETGWGFVTRLLLAAQRQEGLRQAVLESVDEAQPGAFIALLTLIREENLGRFSSVVRAVDVWFGFAWNGEDKLDVNGVIDRVQPLLQDDARRVAQLEAEDAEDVYLALWTCAFHDVETAVERAKLVMERADPEHRYAAMRIIGQARWPSGMSTIQKALDDPDIRVAALAFGYFRFSGDQDKGEEALGALARLMDRIDPKKKSLTIPAAIWPWTARALSRQDIARRMVQMLDKESMLHYLPLVHELDPDERAGAVCTLAGMGEHWSGGKKAKPDRLEEPTYGVVLEFLGDPSSNVRTTAFQALESTPVMKEEVERLVGLLRRKSSDVRTGALGRLTLLPDR